MSDTRPGQSYTVRHRALIRQGRHDGLTPKLRKKSQAGDSPRLGLLATTLWVSRFRLSKNPS